MILDRLLPTAPRARAARRGVSARVARAAFDQPRGGDPGFGLVEVLVAIALLSVVILVVSRGAIVALSASALATEHSAATSLIAADVADVEALPFGDLQLGLNPAADSLSSDPNIVHSGSIYTLSTTGATLATANTSSSQPPLVPHVTTVSVGGVAYRVASYPSTNVTSGLVTVVVIVNWTSSTGVRAKAVGETQIDAP